MSGLIKLREEVHNRVLKIRQIEHLVASARFGKAWDLADPDEQGALKLMLANADAQAVNTWISNFLHSDLGELSWRELMKLAKDRHIRKYSRLSKLDLIVEITEWEERHGEKQGRDVGGDGGDAGGDVQYAGDEYGETPTDPRD
jgi:hypothetical protein